MVRDVVENGGDLLRYTKELERLWVASEYSDVLQSVGTLDDRVGIYRTMGEAEESIRPRVPGGYDPVLFN